MKHKICLITGNKNKLTQFQSIVGDSFELQNQKVDLPELQGDAETIAKDKVMRAYKELGRACITEDTSLCFNAYKGLPGPYIKWFLDSVKVEGLANMVKSFDDKTGYAQCIIAYMAPDLVEPILFIGRTEGSIVEPRGSRDFGWDPVFEPKGFDKTYGQLDSAVKNTISHRFRAIQEMVKYFKDKPILVDDKKDTGKQSPKQSPKLSPKQSPKLSPRKSPSPPKSPSKSPSKSPKGKPTPTPSKVKSTPVKDTKSDIKNKKLESKLGGSSKKK